MHACMHASTHACIHGSIKSEVGKFRRHEIDDQEPKTANRKSTIKDRRSRIRSRYSKIEVESNSKSKSKSKVVGGGLPRGPTKRKITVRTFFATKNSAEKAIDIIGYLFGHSKTVIDTKKHKIDIESYEHLFVFGPPKILEAFF